MNAWLGLKRPLFLSFFLACTVSFLTTGTLTFRLIAPSMIYWSFIPITEIAALATVSRNDRHRISFPNLIDSFFRGYSPWFLWLAGLCAIWALMSPPTKRFDWAVSTVWGDGGLALALVWSLYIDFHFF